MEEKIQMDWFDNQGQNIRVPFSRFIFGKSWTVTKVMNHQEKDIFTDVN